MDFSDLTPIYFFHYYYHDAIMKKLGKQRTLYTGWKFHEGYCSPIVLITHCMHCVGRKGKGTRRQKNYLKVVANEISRTLPPTTTRS